jgi:metal-sulfur cluster biosynthetic enzyme
MQRLRGPVGSEEFSMTVRQPPRIDDAVRDVLSDVYDPCCRDKGISVVDMGLLHRATIDRGAAHVELMLTSGWCPFAARVLMEIETAVRSLPGVDTASVELVWDEAWTPERLSESARDKLRFLPDPVTVDDPASFVADHWGSNQEKGAHS